MTSTPPRPTPETDAQVKDFDAPWLYYVNADLARKLERERDEAREQLQAMREVIAAAEKCRHWHDCSYNEDTGKTEGVIISAESFWSLQNALTKLKPFLP